MSQGTRVGEKRGRFDEEDCGGTTEEETDLNTASQNSPAEGGADGDGLDEATMNELDMLRSHTTRFQFRTFPIKVQEMYPWYYTDTAKPSQLKVPENYYQRDRTKGWSDDQKAKYLKTVFAGQAGTPFVINIKRKDARIVDGGHRLNALLEFKQNKVGMQVGSRVISYNQLSETDKEHFDDQNLTILEYKNIPLKDEIGVYIVLNSGLQFSFGEKLAAVQSVNEIVKVSSSLAKLDEAKHVVEKMCSILGKETSGHKHEGRKNELLVLAFCAYNLHFRSARARQTGALAPFCTSMQETFVHTICDFNTAEQVNIPDTLCHDVLRLMEASIAAFEHITGNDTPQEAKQRTGQTPFRRMLICMLLVAERGPDLDKPCFRAMLETLHAGPPRRGQAPLRRILTVSSKSLDPASVRLVVDAYDGFAGGAAAAVQVPPAAAASAAVTASSSPSRADGASALAAGAM